VRRLASPEPHRTLALVWRPRSPLGPALRRLAATIRDACGGAQARLDAAIGQGSPAPAGKGSARSRPAARRRVTP
jgi:hypothetical protein